MIVPYGEQYAGVGVSPATNGGLSVGVASDVATMVSRLGAYEAALGSSLHAVTMPARACPGRRVGTGSPPAPHEYSLFLRSGD